MDIPSLVSNLGGAIQLGGLLVNERDRQKAADIQVDLTNKIIQAQTQLIEIQSTLANKDGEIRDLQDRIRAMDREERERARYKLEKLGEVGDFFAYRLRPAGELTERADEPDHYVCQPCFDAGKKSILRIGAYAAQCSVCGKSTAVKTQPAMRRTVGGGGGSWMGS